MHNLLKKIQESFQAVNMFVFLLWLHLISQTSFFNAWPYIEMKIIEEQKGHLGMRWVRGLRGHGS